MTFKRFLIPFAMLLLLASCQAELVPDMSEEMSLLRERTDDGRVCVSLSCSIAPETPGYGVSAAETRAIEATPAIHTLSIMQFDGTDETADLVGEPQFLTDEADPADREHYLDFTRITLADSHGKDHTVALLANIGAPLDGIRTLGDLKEAYRTIDSQADVFGFAGDNLDFPDDPTRYEARLNALAVGAISAGSNLSAVFRRSAAHITVRIENGGADGLCIRKVRLRNVSRKDYFLTDYRYGTSDAELFGEPFRDEFDRDVQLRFSYPEAAWNGNTDGTGEATYSWYVPANMRGTDPTITDAAGKDVGPNTYGATYLWVQGTYGPDATTVEYRFYLGENLVNNYDIRPNTTYSYQLRFNGKGDSYSDTRVDDFPDVDFEVDANCYILNPSPYRERTFSFNAIHRPNIFWGNRYGLDEKYPNNIIDRTKPWKATLVWSDVAMTQAEAQAFLSKNSGNGDGSYMSDDQRIRVTIPARCSARNVIVGMYIDDPSNLLWSWHLWITDYRPDEVDGRTPTPGAYIYPVQSGEVHRYAGPAWKEGGLYENGYAMDRNLGAWDIKSRSPYFSLGSGMQYEFGRKDPFPFYYKITYYDENGNSSTRGNGEDGDNIVRTSRGSTDHVVYSVNHPAYYLSSYVDQYFNPGISSNRNLWHDPRYMEHVEYEEEGPNADKSIFDPCPPGWRVPRGEADEKMNWLSDMNSTNFLHDQIVNGNSDSFKNGQGWYYYLDAQKSVGIFFPINGLRYYDGMWRGYYSSSIGRYWEENDSGCSSGYSMRTDSYPYPPTTRYSDQKNNGGFVRCVRKG